MRWDNLADNPAKTTTPGTGALFAADAVTTRTFDTPEFRGITFHEIRARSIVNRVPGASRMPFEWTVNPYRGCTHACVYCFARKTHSYLDLDTGLGFDSQIVVKINAPELVRRELSAARWHGAHIAMGTNVDCYQRAEGRYRLMPGILTALRDHANPFSILTKGTLILRDLELLRQAAEVTEVGVSVSVGFTDPELWRTVEPGTPSPSGASTSSAPSASTASDAGCSWHPSSPTSATGRTSCGPRSARSPTRAPRPSPRSSSICGPVPASGSWSGSACTIRIWSGGTSGSTRTAPTPPPGTSAVSPGTCTSWRPSTASAPRTTARRAASRNAARSGPRRPVPSPLS